MKYAFFHITIQPKDLSWCDKKQSPHNYPKLGKLKASKIECLPELHHRTCPGAFSAACALFINLRRTINTDCV